MLSNGIFFNNILRCLIPRLVLVCALAQLLTWGGSVKANSNGPIKPQAFVPIVYACQPVQLMLDGGFEAGLPSAAWQTSSSVFSDILDDSADPAAHSGSWKAWLGGSDSVTETLRQTFTIPAGSGPVQVSYWWRVSTLETNHPFDELSVEIRDTLSNTLQTLEILTDGDADSNWQQSVFTLPAAYAGQTVQLVFVATTDDSSPTSFFIDDVSILTTKCS